MTIRPSHAVVLLVLLSLTSPAFGTCTFGLLSPTSYPAGVKAADLAIADFNRDQVLDVAVLDRSFDENIPSYITVLFGNGVGGFSSNATSINVVEAAQSDIAAGDLNGDGKADLIVGINWAKNFTVLPHLKLFLGDGNGNFTATDGPNVSMNAPKRFVLDDFNGDGKLDVAVTKAGPSGGFAIFLNGPAGLTFSNEYVSGGNVVYDSMSMTEGDFDADTKMDLAFTQVGTGDVHIFFGGGDGTFTPTNGLTLNTTLTASVFGVTAADFNGDGRADLAVASNITTGPTTKLSLFLSNGDRTFASPTQWGTLQNTREPKSIDLDGDGKLDVIVPNNGQLELFRGNGDGTFAQQQTYDNLGGGEAIDIADFDRDGGPDIVGTNFGNGTSAGSAVIRLNNCGRIRLTLTSSANPANEGTDITVTATAIAPAAVAPTGTITISREGNTLASTNLATSMSTNTTLIDLVPGSYAVTADYSGDSRFVPWTTILQQVVQVPPFGPPPRVTAISFGGPVALSWIGTQGVDHYEIWRSNGAGFASAGTSATTQFTDSNVATNMAYLYKVRGVSPGSTMSDFSPVDPAITYVFTDETLTAGVTTVKLAHLTELRSAVNAVRNVVGLGNVMWSEESPTVVLASHWTELRTAIAEMRSIALLRAVTFTDTLAAGVPIRAVHVTELRNATR